MSVERGRARLSYLEATCQQHQPNIKVGKDADEKEDTSNDTLVLKKNYRFIKIMQYRFKLRMSFLSSFCTFFGCLML